MTKIYLVRHGATEWNLTKRAQGSADIELDPTGIRQAKAVARSLQAEELVAVYSSDLKRAVDTARLVATKHGLEVTIEPAFREIDQGEWTGLTVQEIAVRWPELWGPARHYNARPGGESPAQVRERALAGLERVVSAYPDGGVAVVSHGGTIRCLSAAILGYDDRRVARIRGLGNGAVVSFEATRGPKGLEFAGFVRLDGATPDLDDPND